MKERHEEPQLSDQVYDTPATKEGLGDGIDRQQLHPPEDLVGDPEHDLDDWERLVFFSQYNPIFGPPILSRFDDPSADDNDDNDDNNDVYDVYDVYPDSDTLNGAPTSG